VDLRLLPSRFPYTQITRRIQCDDEEGAIGLTRLAGDGERKRPAVLILYGTRLSFMRTQVQPRHASQAV
jgi:hypothetical protein